ncbi:hypothetical protein BGW38_007732 [Lunasporangiospora selenospora]|uniref:Uncharacterized protein n=1 Tax=Lunasporangiospora selenospora TaxID=979761 RepID=A0A9P6FKR9_9FUNG|nr:hypothetical protein BGW38_007732 [Lunasporangiospora selenospora]
MLAPPKAGATVGAAKPGLARPSGLQAPRTGLQPPRASSTLPAKSPSGLVKPGVSGLAAPGSRLPAGARAGATTGRAGVTAPGAAGAATTGAKRTLPGRTTPSTPAGTGIARPGTKSMLVAPGSARAPSRSGTATNLANRHSLLPSPASSTHSRTASTSSSTSRAGSTSMLMSPKRTQVSSTKNASTRLPASPASSTSSLSGLGSGHTSQRSIGSAGQLMRPKTQAANGRSVSMYGASSLLHQQAPLHHEEQEYGNFEEDDYSVLTPPQSPSSRDGRQRSSSNGHLNSGIKPGVRTLGGGIPRSGIAAPSRLIPPALSTSRIGRPASPSPASAGSNHSGSGLYFPRPHTPTSRITGSTGLVSPRAGRHA